jgi:Holliday junction DNA helicase RuvA
MIAKLTGTILETGPRHAVLDVGGVGYKVFLTDDTLHGMKAGAKASFWTHLAVREDALDLYGFASERDKGLFGLLITVSGIGPKSALNILSLVSAEALASSIETGSVAHLVKVSGIGRKTAEKIVLELKDRMGSVERGGEGMAAGLSSDMDAIEALRALGYGADEARDALKKASAGGKDLDIGTKVKAALKELGR